MRQTLARAAIVVVVLSAFFGALFYLSDVGRRYQCPEGRAPIRTAFGDVVCAIKAEPIE